MKLNELAVDQRYTFITAACFITGTIYEISTNAKILDLSSVDIHTLNNLDDVKRVPVCELKTEHIIGIMPALSPASDK